MILLTTCGIAATTVTQALRAWEVPRQERPAALPVGIGTRPDYTGPLPAIGTLGRTPALAAENKVAIAILAKAPGGPMPIDVGRFFLRVGQGNYGAAWMPYTRGWPDRWNPVIVKFFHATATYPEGDMTPWCAAFVNWCFEQAGKGRATQSASSGSFRTFGSETHSPVVGDVVVFRSTDPAKAKEGKGHVGFFVTQDANNIEVLGGNQIDRHDGCHIISLKRIPRKGTLLELHSFRTDPRLRG